MSVPETAVPPTASPTESPSSEAAEAAVAAITGAANQEVTFSLALTQDQKDIRDWVHGFAAETGAAVTILFGSVFTIPSSTIPLVLVLALAVLAILLTVHRSLLLSSVSPEMAAARGIPVRAIGLAYLLALSLSISLCALTIGAILSTALLVGPAAAALRVTRRPGVAILTAGLLGVGATWLGILLAYDSYYWPPAGRGWPVSFFVVSLVFVIYLLCGLPAWRAARARRTTTPGPQAVS